MFCIGHSVACRDLICVIFPDVYVGGQKSIDDAEPFLHTKVLDGDFCCSGTGMLMP